MHCLLEAFLRAGNGIKMKAKIRLLLSVRSEEVITTATWLLRTENRNAKTQGVEEWGTKNRQDKFCTLTRDGNTKSEIFSRQEAEKFGSYLWGRVLGDIDYGKPPPNQSWYRIILWRLEKDGREFQDNPSYMVRLCLCRSVFEYLLNVLGEILMLSN